MLEESDRSFSHLGQACGRIFRTVVDTVPNDDRQRAANWDI